MKFEAITNFYPHFNPCTKRKSTLIANVDYFLARLSSIGAGNYYGSEPGNEKGEHECQQDVDIAGRSFELFPNEYSP